MIIMVDMDKLMPYMEVLELQREMIVLMKHLKGLKEMELEMDKRLLTVARRLKDLNRVHKIKIDNNVKKEVMKRTMGW